MGWEEGFFMRLLEKPPFHYKSGETVPEPLQYTGELLAAADFVVVVTPEMNHTIAPGRVSLMSHFGSSHYQFKPSGVVPEPVLRCGHFCRSWAACQSLRWWLCLVPSR